MRIMLINPPYVTITSRVGVGHQIPLGLLAIGGALLDGGHDMTLLDAEVKHLSDDDIIARIHDVDPDVVMTGHAGSTPAHPTCMRMLKTIAAMRPDIISVYGGVYPTYHSRHILQTNPAVDIIVHGEGEAAAVDVADALATGDPNTQRSLRHVLGISFRTDDGAIVRTADRAPIRCLDDFRVGWELIDDWDRYQCFGLGRAAIVQFSRGCPHRCSYCGQHGFWNRWRHRDPEELADEIAWLHREHDIRFITLADENPTTSPKLWRQFLQAVAARNVDVQFFATIRADDIVRDADILDLYRRAGVLYVLLGIDTTNPRIMYAVQKRSAVTTDQRACELLRAHRIRSIIAQIVGLGDETPSSLKQTRRALATYKGDLLNVMYATPHTWTAFAQQRADHRIMQNDQRWWDYRHQILQSTAMKPWQLFAAVKWMEFTFHARPSRLLRLLAEPDSRMRVQLWWTALHIGGVWVAEIWECLRAVRFAAQPRQLREWLSTSDHANNQEQRSMPIIEVSVSATPADGTSAPVELSIQ